jgi:hypothetical protein
MRVLAVDFGTSNTAVAVGDTGGGPPRLVAVDGLPVVPSSIYLGDDGVLSVGRDADRQARLDPSRFEPNPKRRIDEGVLLLGTSMVPVVDAVGAVFGRVVGEVGRQLGGGVDQVRLTHPARWGRRRLDTLVAASRQAGLADDPVLVPEPVAAAMHFAALSGQGLADGAALAVYDLGGGTFDVAVVQRSGAEYRVLAEAGLDDLGGLDFDHAILEHIGRTPAAQADPAAWQRLRSPADSASRRAARALATDVRDGKEALSRHPHVDIALPPPFVDVHLTRLELEDLIRPDLQRSVDLLAATIRDAGYSAQGLAGVYLVGGSSRIPLIARLIQRTLQVTPTTLDQPETSVATGAVYLPAGGRPDTQATGTASPPGLLATSPATPPGLPATSAEWPPAPGSGPTPAPRATSYEWSPSPVPPRTPTTTAPQATSGEWPTSGSEAVAAPQATSGEWLAAPGAQVASGPQATPQASPQATSQEWSVPPPAASPGWSARQATPAPQVAPAPQATSGQWPAQQTPARQAPPPPQPAQPVRQGGWPDPNRQWQPPAPPAVPRQPYGQQAGPRPPYQQPGPYSQIPAPWPNQQPPKKASHRPAIIGGSVAAVLVLVVTLLLVNGPNTKYDKYFKNSTLRGYVRPFYDDITSCEESTDVPLVTGATCDFRTGERVDLIALNDGVSITRWRTTLANAADSNNVSRGTWRDGELWTLEDDGNPALYWDVEGSNVAGLAVLSGGSEETLRGWWEGSFGQ